MKMQKRAEFGKNAFTAGLLLYLVTVLMHILFVIRYFKDVNLDLAVAVPNEIKVAIAVSLVALIGSAILLSFIRVNEVILVLPLILSFANIAGYRSINKIFVVAAAIVAACAVVCILLNFFTEGGNFLKIGTILMTVLLILFVGFTLYICFSEAVRGYKMEGSGFVSVILYVLNVIKRAAGQAVGNYPWLLFNILIDVFTLGIAKKAAKETK